MDGFFLVRSYSLVVVWCCCHPCKFFPFWNFFFLFQYNISRLQYCITLCASMNIMRIYNMWSARPRQRHTPSTQRTQKSGRVEMNASWRVRLQGTFRAAHSSFIMHIYVLCVVHAICVCVSVCTCYHNFIECSIWLDGGYQCGSSVGARAANVYIHDDTGTPWLVVACTAIGNHAKDTARNRRRVVTGSRRWDGVHGNVQHQPIQYSLIISLCLERVVATTYHLSPTNAYV